MKRRSHSGWRATSPSRAESPAAKRKKFGIIPGDPTQVRCEEDCPRSSQIIAVQAAQNTCEDRSRRWRTAERKHQSKETFPQSRTSPAGFRSPQFPVVELARDQRHSGRNVVEPYVVVALCW